MATMVTEVTSTDKALAATVNSVMKWFCSTQTAFQLEYLELPKSAIQGSTRLYVPDVFESIRNAQKEMRGTHDRIILFTQSPLDGEVYSNLFSSLEEDPEDRFTGLAVVTTSDVELLTNGLPLEGYLFQQLVSINLRWVVGRAMLHEDSPDDCLFHKRIDKRRIVLSVKEMRLCDHCREQARSLDDKQWQSLKNIMHSVSQAMNADDPQQEMDELLAQRKYANYSLYSWRNPKKTLVEDVIDNWRRFRKGRSRYTIAAILAIGGIAVIDPPWWQKCLEAVLGIHAGSEPSVIQQIIGFLVIFLAFLLVFVNAPQPRET